MRAELRARSNPSSILVPAGVIVYTLGIVCLQALSLIDLELALIALLAPATVVAAAVRPEWVVLLFLATPASVMGAVQARRLTAPVLLILAIMLITEGKLYIDRKSGLFPIVVIVVAGHYFLANVGVEAAELNSSLLKYFEYYLLLGLASYNLTRRGRLNGDALANALLVGILLTAAMGNIGLSRFTGEEGGNLFTRSYFAYLAVMGMAVCFARLLHRRYERNPQMATINRVLLGLFGFLVMISFVRAAWLSALVVVLLLAHRVGKRKYWLLVPAIMLAIVIIPSARQEITSTSSGDFAESLETGSFTSGRGSLWPKLWDRGYEALPWGNGFGYMWSLSAEQIYGSQGQFGEEAKGSLFAHNDFLFLFVEFGILGPVLMVIFWVHLFKAAGKLFRSADERLRQHTLPFIGVLSTALFATSLDNFLFLKPLMERLFIVAGFIFGLAALQRESARQTADLMEAAA